MQRAATGRDQRGRAQPFHGRPPGHVRRRAHVGDFAADADTLKKAGTAADACCGTTAGRTSDEQAGGPAQTSAEAETADECACGP